jgi:hypothetical protein
MPHRRAKCLPVSSWASLWVGQCRGTGEQIAGGAPTRGSHRDKVFMLRLIIVARWPAPSRVLELALRLGGDLALEGSKGVCV